MKTFVILGMSLWWGLFSFVAAAPFQEVRVDEITATITATTSEKELKDLVAFFEEHHLALQVKQKQRNDQGALTGLHISLQHQKQRRQYNMSSSHPIADLELGAKDGTLFIQAAGNNQITGALSNLLPSGINSSNSISTLMRQFGFDMDMNFDFNVPTDSLFFGGNFFDMDKIKEQITKAIENELNPKSKYFPLQESSTPKASKPRLPKYSFINQSHANKLIIIDGQKATFKILNQLAKNDQLEAVDFLKSSTATSIYGKHAQHGVIIATTKK